MLLTLSLIIASRDTWCKRRVKCLQRMAMGVRVRKRRPARAGGESTRSDTPRARAARARAPSSNISNSSIAARHAYA